MQQSKVWQQSPALCQISNLYFCHDILSWFGNEFFQVSPSDNPCLEARDKRKITSGYFKACMKTSENGLACNKECATTSTAAICVFLYLMTLCWDQLLFRSLFSNRLIKQDDIWDCSCYFNCPVVCRDYYLDVLLLKFGHFGGRVLVEPVFDARWAGLL